MILRILHVLLYMKRERLYRDLSLFMYIVLRVTTAAVAIIFP